jgi:hypothetical protein
VTDKIDAALIEQAGPQMKLIANFGNGVDNIDVEAAQKKGITVTNTPNVLSDDTADMTMALMLAVPRRLTEGANVLSAMAAGRAGRRPGCSATALAASGSASSAWAASAPRWPAAPRPSACRSITTTAAVSIPATEDQLEATYWDSLDQMLARVDIVSVNCPSTPATFHLLSARRLELMKPGAYIVNTARGGIIDEDALIKALREGRLVRRRVSMCSSMSPRSTSAWSSSLRRRQGGAVAAYGIGHHRGPDRHGRQGDHQHPHLLRRPPPARPRAAAPELKLTLRVWDHAKTCWSFVQLFRP